jgi:hypothetical protein
LLHAEEVSEAHVIVYEGQNLIGLVVGEAEAAADFGGHFYADVDVAIEADAIGRSAEGWGLAYVVQQGSPG